MPQAVAQNLVDFLSSVPDLGARPQGAMRAADFTLDRIRALLHALGDPQQAYPSLHVAGTNGKGSVCALCAATLQAEGYKVGLFTSPHVDGALRGIVIDGDLVNLADLEETFQVLAPHLQIADGWTQFEVVTALAFLQFARAKVDAVVIEVGLGGRLDATNVLVPLVSVITPIDYDHTSILGNTLAEIATEKAGIIKEGVPLILAPQAAEARATILAIAKSQAVPVTEVGKVILFERVSSDLQGQALRVSKTAAPNESIELQIGLLGAYQIENAATAYAALQVLNEHGLLVSADAIQRGFAAARWPGRFELLAHDPPLVLDAAHTPAAARALRLALDEYFPDQPVTLILGVSADKDLEGLLAPLRPRLQQVIVTQSPHPRAMPADELIKRIAGLGIPAVGEPDAAAALKLGFIQAKNSGVVLVAGSVFLVEWVRGIYLKQKKGGVLVHRRP
jgi:dihydrofolate synthase/folylpolyglutamate synthase